MKRIHIRLLVSALAALAAVLVGIIEGAPAAFARADPPGFPWIRPRHPIPFPAHTHAHAAAGGLANWPVALILAGAAILCAVAVLIRRARAARRRRPATAGWTDRRESASSSAAR